MQGVRQNSVKGLPIEGRLPFEAGGDLSFFQNGNLFINHPTPNGNFQLTNGIFGKGTQLPIGNIGSVTIGANGTIDKAKIGDATNYVIFQSNGSGIVVTAAKISGKGFSFTYDPKQGPSGKAQISHYEIELGTSAFAITGKKLGSPFVGEPTIGLNLKTKGLT